MVLDSSHVFYNCVLEKPQGLEACHYVSSESVHLTQTVALVPSSMRKGDQMTPINQKDAYFLTAV